MTTSSETPVTIEGERVLEVAGTPADRERFGWETEAFTIHCHTGRVIEGRWTGTPVTPLIDEAKLPGDSTHVLVTATDGHVACVEIRRLFEGLIGFVCEEVDPGHDEEAFDDDWEDTPRLLAPDIDSFRAVRNVTSIEPIALAPGENPEEYEDYERKNDDERASDGDDPVEAVTE